MIVTTILSILFFILFVIFFSVNFKKRKDILNSDNKDKLINAKTKCKAKMVLLKVIPVLISIVIIAISSVYIYKNNYKEQAKVTIYRNGEAYYPLTDSEVLNNIKNEIIDVVLVSAIIWSILDIICYIIFASSIGKNKKLSKEEAEILSKYHSGKIAYKLMITIFCVILFINISGYVLPAMGIIK